MTWNWLLNFKFLLLAAGCWLLAAGCWLLAAGWWLLAAAGWQARTRYRVKAQASKSQPIKPSFQVIQEQICTVCNVHTGL
jgi:high-affinity Fe2+/Pb2+ permease